MRPLGRSLALALSSSSTAPPGSLQCGLQLHAGFLEDTATFALWLLSCKPEVWKDELRRCLIFPVSLIGLFIHPSSTS